MDQGLILDEMRREEQAGDTSALLLALNQGRRAAQLKKLFPKTWKSDLLDATGKGKSTWHQRVAIARDFGAFLLPDIPLEHVSTLPSSLALLTSITKGTDEACRQAHLEQIAGLSYADVKKYVQEIKGEVHDCGPFEEVQVKAWKCTVCGKVRTKEPEGDTTEPCCEGGEDQG